MYWHRPIPYSFSFFILFLMKVSGKYFPFSLSFSLFFAFYKTKKNKKILGGATAPIAPPGYATDLNIIFFIQHRAIKKNRSNNCFDQGWIWLAKSNRWRHNFRGLALHARSTPMPHQRVVTGSLLAACTGRALWAACPELSSGSYRDIG